MSVSTSTYLGWTIFSDVTGDFCAARVDGFLIMLGGSDRDSSLVFVDHDGTMAHFPVNSFPLDVKQSIAAVNRSVATGAYNDAFAWLMESLPSHLDRIKEDPNFTLLSVKESLGNSNRLLDTMEYMPSDYQRLIVAYVALCDAHGIEVGDLLPADEAQVFSFILYRYLHN